MRRKLSTLALPFPQSRFKTSAPPWLFSTLLNFVMHPWTRVLEKQTCSCCTSSLLFPQYFTAPLFSMAREMEKEFGGQICCGLIIVKQEPP
jgi:hypothetical protein